MSRLDLRSRLLWPALVGLALAGLLVPAAEALALRSQAFSWLRPALILFRPNTETARLSTAALRSGDAEARSPDAAALEREVQELRAECLRQRDENRRLRALEGIAPTEAERPPGALARVLAREVLWQEPILGLDRGVQDGVRKGAGVLSRGAVVGRIVSVAPRASCLALVTHRGVSISARLADCRAEGVLQGTRDSGGARLCRMKVVGVELAARAGEQVLTSGLDGCFPPGCWLGTVQSTARTGSLEWEVTVRPACEAPALEGVYILTEAPLDIPWPEAPGKKK